MQNEPTEPRPGDYFVENQFLVSGPNESRSSIQQVVEDALKDLCQEKGVPPPQPVGEPVDLAMLERVMVIYEFEDMERPDKESAFLVGSAVLLINQQGDGVVVADLNYLARPLPWEVGGSPGYAATDTSPIDLKNQWAFQGNGIDWAANTNTPRMTGAGVDIYAFDTCHLCEGGPYTFEGMQFEVKDFLLPTSVGTGPVQDHGLFVSSLFHRVAMDSTIHLMRVLDGEAQGRLDRLLKALNSLKKPDNIYANMVFNLSLQVGGLPADPQAIGLPDDFPGSDMPDLRNTLDAFSSGQCVIVAAAGNESEDELAYPARYDFVIGVVGSNRWGTRSCFSNYPPVFAPPVPGMNVAAPGGDGGGEDCSFLEDLSENLAENLVGFASLSSTNYAVWSGTSFATALVSGLAARFIQKKLSSAPGIVPDVPAAIKGTAPTGGPSDLANGIIKV